MSTLPRSSQDLAAHFLEWNSSICISSSFLPFFFPKWVSLLQAANHLVFFLCFLRVFWRFWSDAWCSFPRRVGLPLRWFHPPLLLFSVGWFAGLPSDSVMIGSFSSWHLYRHVLLLVLNKIKTEWMFFLSLFPPLLLHAVLTSLVCPVPSHFILVFSFY